MNILFNPGLGLLFVGAFYVVGFAAYSMNQIKVALITKVPRDPNAPPRTKSN